MKKRARDHTRDDEKDEDDMDAKLREAKIILEYKPTHVIFDPQFFDIPRPIEKSKAYLTVMGEMPEDVLKAMRSEDFRSAIKQYVSAKAKPKLFNLNDIKKRTKYSSEDEHSKEYLQFQSSRVNI